MAVTLDDGRSVRFDMKDYADIDHGYAATIHKAQGMTVDNVHVLATPGLDRHASYVALARHRGSVDLHYGQDDFADQGKLARTPRRDPFAGLKLNAPPIIGRAELPSFDKAVQRYARALQDAFGMHDKGLEPLVEQSQAIARTREAMRALRPDAPRDPAAAFEAMRQEVSLLHQAIRGLAAARENIPDYSETLGQTNDALHAIHGRLKAIEGRPAMS